MAGFIPSDYSGVPPPASNPTTYVFPVLKLSDIQQCLEELGVDFLTKAELTEPQRHKEKIRKAFWKLLDICCGIDEEGLAKQSPNLDGMKYSDLHDEVTDVLFFQELRKCLATCCVYDFSWKDLHNPTSKRLRVQLSAILNMAKFREEQLKVFSELCEPRTQLILALEDVNKEHWDVSEHLEQVQAESDARLDELEKVMKDCHELETEITRSSKLQASKREHAATLKREANDLKDELSSATWALQETQAEEERLMSEVVSSPGRRKNELAVRRERLEKEKDEARNLQDQLLESKAKKVPIQQAIKTTKGVLILQQQVLEEATQYDEAVEKVNATTKGVAGNVERTTQLKVETEEAERGWMRTEEKIANMRKQGKIMMQAAQDALETAKEQLLLGEKDRREGMARVEAAEADVRALERQVQAEQVQTEREIAALLADFKESEKAFLLCNEQRMHAMGIAI